MLERDLEKMMVCEIKKAGGKAYKFISPGNSGVPDRIVIMPGRTPLFVELKADKGKLTRLQSLQTEKLKSLGQAVQVVYGPAGLRKFFNSLGLFDSANRLEKIMGGLEP